MNELTFLDRYEPYLVSYTTSAISLRVVQLKYPAMDKLLKVCPFSSHHSCFHLIHQKFEEDQKSTTMLSPESIMIMPVQRIPRFILLVRDYQKYCGELEDGKVMGEAGSKLDAELQRMNSKIDPSLQLRMRKVLDIVKSIQGLEIVRLLHLRSPSNCSQDLLDREREYIYEGYLTFLKKVNKMGEEEKKKQKCFFFLFNDLFVVCEEKPNAKEEDEVQFVLLSTIDTSLIRVCPPSSFASSEFIRTWPPSRPRDFALPSSSHLTLCGGNWSPPRPQCETFGSMSSRGSSLRRAADLPLALFRVLISLLLPPSKQSEE